MDTQFLSVSVANQIEGFFDNNVERIVKVGESIAPLPMDQRPEELHKQLLALDNFEDIFIVSP